MSLLDVSGLTIRFGANAVVDGVGFSIGRGERFGIIGESGSGKTLTSLAVAGLLPEGASADGEILFDGTALPQTDREMARLRGKRIGMVFQEPMTALNPLMRIGRQIGEAIDLAATGVAVASLLQEVGLETAHADRYPHQLSGGQRQRVMIAMALASEPDLLIADEPTSALDLITQSRVLDLIANVCERREMALLFISHDLRAVARLCTRVVVMQGGRLVESGETRQVFSAPQEAYTQKLVSASRFALPARGSRPSSETLLDVDGITRDYRQKGFGWWGQKPLRAVDGVSFTVQTGACVALVGPSGCGKSTLARIIVGLDQATSGVMRLSDTHYHGSDVPRAHRRDLSLVFQDPFSSFNPRLSVAASLAEPLRLEPGLSQEEARSRVVQAAEAVGLSESMLSRYPHEFSGGQRQRLAISRALVTRPKLLVLDEPVSALDVSVRGEVLALLARLQAQFGLTYLLISHDLEMVAAMADRVLIMEAGRIVEQGEPDRVFDAPQHRLTRDLVAARLPDLNVV